MQKVKKMGVWELTLLVLVNMMGSGIILLPTKLASVGTISILSWFITGGAVACLAYAFAKCGMFSRRGGGMGGYAEYSFGKAGNFMTNYTYSITALLADVAIALTAVAYALQVLGIESNATTICIGTLIAIWAATALSVGGPKSVGRITSFTVLGVIVPVLGICIIGWFWFSPSLWVNEWNPQHMPFFKAVSSSIALTLWSFAGFESAVSNSDAVENPEKNVPRAVRTIFWRILLFYLGSFIVIGFLIPYTDPNLLKSDVQSISISPFTLVFKRLGLAGAASLMNAILLTSVLSSGNSGVYVATRMLYAMARAGQAPKCFLKVNSRGIPINGLYATVAFGLAAFLTSLIGDGVAYNWLVNMSGLAGFIAWIGIAICHYRFRKAYVAQGKDLNKLPYKAPLYPFGPILAFLMCVFVTAGQNYTAFLGDHIDWYGVSVAYIGLPVFLATFLYHKIKYRTHVVPLDKVDLSRHE